MSNLLSSTGDDHPEAAGKHLTDALLLNQSNRFDGAGYLAGYVIETSLKSIILVELGTGAASNLLHHRINELSTQAIQLAMLPTARTARYVPQKTSGHPIYDTSNGWKETLRYRQQGIITQSIAQTWVDEAKAIYESTIVPMRLDGVI